MRITLRNNFHNSEVALIVPGLPYTLSKSQAARARRELCGLHDCTCGIVRGPQHSDGRRLAVGAEGHFSWRIEEE